MDKKKNMFIVHISHSYTQKIMNKYMQNIIQKLFVSIITLR